MVTQFATMDEAVRARTKWTQRLILINGTPTRCTDASTNHTVNGNGIGTATLTIEAPIPDHVSEGAALEIQAGYPGQIATVFSGTIPRLTAVAGTRGKWTTITGRGHLDRLTDAHPTILTWTGSIAMKEVIRSILELRALPYYVIDEITWPDGETVMLASNNKANEGKITIPTTMGLRSWAQSALALVGYRLFDTPNGVVRVKRISGEPVGTPIIEVEEGVLGYTFSRSVDLDPMVTYNIVRGVRFTDEAGIQRTIRSIPATVELDPRLVPLGYRKGEVSNDLIDTQENADYARNVLEIDRAAPSEPHEWSTDFAPHIQPGNIASVTSDTVGANGLLWITDVAHNLSSGSLKTTTYDGVRGNGEALPAGQDCVTTNILPGSRHLGDEYLSWYRNPTPSGTLVKLPFTPGADYTSIYALIDAHGTNSYMLSGKNADSTVSRFEIWQGGEKKSEGNLKVLGEDYSLRRPYGPTDQYWTKDIAIPMTGSLEGGVPAELHIISGKDTRASAGPWDDFEIKNVRLTQCGVGVPVLIDPGA
jgi:hypothetical protein